MVEAELFVLGGEGHSHFICMDIERIQRNLIWGDSKTRKNIHLVKWGTLCLPKHDGRLEIKRPHVMNDAFLMKLFWNLLSPPGDLKSQVLRGKYGRSLLL